MPARPARRLLAAVLRAFVFGVLWWIVAEGRWQSLYMAAVFMLAAVAASLVLLPPAARVWRPGRLPRLVLYFLAQSLVGGIDVARRALSPALPVRPRIMQYESSLPDGFPTALFIWCVSLMPGTASVCIRERVLTVHVLDASMGAREKLRALERHVSRIFV